MPDIISTAAVLTIDNGKVLLVKHTEKASHLTGTYGLPGGRVNVNETEKETAIREFHEETGLKASPDSFIDYPNNVYFAKIKRKNNETMNTSWHVFICTKFFGKIKISEEETIPQWIKIEDLDKYNLLPNTKEAVLDGMKFLKNEK